jgi:7-cyano-7-deazaguanine synthase
MVVPVYLQCGLRWEAAELHWLRRVLRYLRANALRSLQRIELPLHGVYGHHWSFTGRRVPHATSRDAAVYLPGRNVLLISTAAIVSAERGMSAIALGVLKGNPFGDATPRFFARLADCLTQALSYPIRVLAPLRRLTKAQLIRSADPACLAFTFSCLNPRGLTHCGRCNKCAERQRAFRAASVPDPTVYAR